MDEPHHDGERKQTSPGKQQGRERDEVFCLSYLQIVCLYKSRNIVD